MPTLRSKSPFSKKNTAEVKKKNWNWMHLDVGVLNALVTMVIRGLYYVTSTASCLSSGLWSESKNQLLTRQLSKISLLFLHLNAFYRVYVQGFINLPQIKYSLLFEWDVCRKDISINAYCRHNLVLRCECGSRGMRTFLSALKHI